MQAMGDPTVLGWLIVGAYGVAAGAALMAGRRAASARAASFWYVTSAVLLGLGINKQLDLQTALINVARSLAQAQGWYPQRRVVQGAFLGAAGLAYLAAAAAIGAFVRGAPISMKLAGFGLVLLMTYVVFQAAAFNHALTRLGIAEAPAGMASWVELGAIFLIGAATLRQLAGPKTVQIEPRMGRAKLRRVGPHERHSR